MFLLNALMFLSVAFSSNSVSSLGYAELMVDPDIAFYTISVTTKGENVKSAQGENAKQSKAVYEILTTQFGFKEQDWKNSISMEKDYEYVNNKPVLKGHIVRNNIILKVKELNTLGTIMDAVGALGAETGYVQYALEKSEAARAAVLQLASENAAVNANAMLKPYGKQVGQVLAIVQSGASEPAFRKESVSAARSLSADGGGSPSTQVNAGQIKLTATVTVVFEIK